MILFFDLLPVTISFVGRLYRALTARSRFLFVASCLKILSTVLIIRVIRLIRVIRVINSLLWFEKVLLCPSPLELQH